MSQVLKINRPAISPQLSINELSIKVYTHGAPHYGDNKLILQATATYKYHYRIYADSQ